MSETWGLTGECCCDTGCEYFKDTFTRGDSTDLGADWTETAGDSSILSQKLRLPSSFSSVACNTLHPSGAMAYIARAEGYPRAADDVLRLTIDDGNVVAEMIAVKNRLRMLVGGTLRGSVFYGVPANQPRIMLAHTNGTDVSVGGPLGYYMTAPAAITSSRCGVATGSVSGGVDFSEFILSKDASTDTACPSFPVGCAIFTDDNKSDLFASPPSPPDWIEIAGSWSYANNYYGYGYTYFHGPKVSSSGAIAVPNVVNPYDVTMYSFANLIPTSTIGGYGTAFSFPRVIGDYVDPDNYVFVEAGWRGYPYSPTYIRFGRRVAGVDTIVGSVDAREPYGGPSLYPLCYPVRVVLSIGATESNACIEGYGEGLFKKCLGSVSHTPSSGRGGLATATDSTGDAGFESHSLWRYPAGGAPCDCARHSC